MKTLVLAVLLMACQKHDDAPTSTTTPSATVSAAASVTPLATIEPSATASAAPSAAIVDAGPSEAQKQRQLALSKEAEQMQIQMLKAFGSGPGAQGALNRNDLPPVDLSAVADSTRDAGRSGGDLRLGTGGGAIRPGGPGGLAGIGARDH